jgi:hypothetical protein
MTLITQKILDKALSKMEMKLYGATYHSLKNKCYTRLQNQFNSELYQLLNNRLGYSVRYNLREE